MSEKPKFAEGPWEVAGSRRDVVVLVSTNAILADVHSGSPSETINWDVVTANANLIAASPLGYELAEMVIAFLRPPGDQILIGEARRIYDKAREFLRVAKGE